METTTTYIGVVLVSYVGDVLGIYWDTGQENGNYYTVYWVYVGGLCRGYIGDGLIDKTMETTT